MTLLSWRPGRREDRDALRQFACTETSRRVLRVWGWATEHPAPHELVVQSMIRDRLRPVGEPGRTVLMGWHADGSLGAVTSYRALEAASFQIDVIAVAMRFRHQGGGYGREALSTTLDFITADADAAIHSVARVGAVVHERNRPAQRLFAGQLFDQTDELEDSYQGWSAEIPVEGTLL